MSEAHLGRNPVYVIRDDASEIEMLADARSLTRVIGLRGTGS